MGSDEETNREWVWRIARELKDGSIGGITCTCTIKMTQGIRHCVQRHSMDIKVASPQSLRMLFLWHVQLLHWRADFSSGEKLRGGGGEMIRLYNVRKEGIWNEELWNTALGWKWGAEGGEMSIRTWGALRFSLPVTYYFFIFNSWYHCENIDGWFWYLCE